MNCVFLSDLCYLNKLALPCLLGERDGFSVLHPSCVSNWKPMELLGVNKQTCWWGFPQSHNPLWSHMPDSLLSIVKRTRCCRIIEFLNNSGNNALYLSCLITCGTLGSINHILLHKFYAAASTLVVWYGRCVSYLPLILHTTIMSAWECAVFYGHYSIGFTDKNK